MACPLKYVPLFFLCCSCQFIGSIYTGGTHVASVLLDDRSLADDWQDHQINWAVRDALIKEERKLGLDIEVTVFEGKVLLTGALPSADWVNKVLDIAWRQKGVIKVYNYIYISKQPDLVDVHEEALLSAKIRTQLSVTTGIKGSNYKITMSDKVVYVMGIHASEEEKIKVRAVIENTPDVRQVVFLTRPKAG